MLLRAVKRSNPACEATVIVRDGRVSGDVTLADAAQVGLGEVARVVSNGNDVAGTCERLLSGEARQVLVATDVVVSKGLANFETLRGRRVGNARTFFLFMVKCELYAREFGASLGDVMAVRGV